MSITRSEARRLSLRNKRNNLIKHGFTSRLPTEPGEYVVACNEVDYDKYRVEVVERDGELLVNDPKIGTAPVDRYDLTDLLWRREDDD